MGTAAGLLEQRQTGAATQTVEGQALAKLELLLEALKPEAPAASPNNSGGGAPGQGEKPPAGLQSVNELKLLKLMQQQLNLRAQRLQEAVDRGGKLTDEQRQQYAGLGEEQGRLAELTLQLLRAQPQNPEDNPAELPELLPDEDKLRPQPRQTPQEESP